ncbi:UNVERIFIED_CONTAM: hypothetical protein RMT77_019952 [Armadillidium vulgare]
MLYENNLLSRDILGIELKMKSNLPKSPALHKAAACGDCETILRIIGSGVHINLTNKLDGNNTALHYAVVFNHVPAVYLLARLNADIEAKGYCGYTPLGMAVRSENDDVVHVLLSWGADVLSDRFLLPSAINNLREDTFMMLIKAGAHFYNTNDKNMSLINACLKNRLNIIDYLLSIGANPVYNPTECSSLTSYLINCNCSISVLKQLFLAQLKISEPITPPALKNKSKFEFLYTTKRLRRSEEH